MESKLKNKFEDFKVSPSDKLWTGISDQLGSKGLLNMSRLLLRKNLVILSLFVVGVSTSVFFMVRQENNNADEVVDNAVAVQQPVINDVDMAISEPPVNVPQEVFVNEDNVVVSLAQNDVPRESVDPGNETSLEEEPGTVALNEVEQDINSEPGGVDNMSHFADLAFAKIPDQMTMLEILSSKEQNLRDDDIKRIKKPGNRFKLLDYVGAYAGRSLNSKTESTAIEKFDATTVLSTSERDLQASFCGLTLGRYSGSWILETGLQYTRWESDFSLTEKSKTETMDILPYKDSVGFVYVTGDGSITILYEKGIDTVYSTMDKEEIFKSKRKYSAVQVPFNLGYGYSVGKFSFLMKGGVLANIMLDYTQDIDRDMPGATVPSNYELNWAVSFSPEIWYSVSERLDFKLGAHYYQILSDNGKVLLPYEANANIRYSAGINYRVGSIFR